MNKQSLPPTGSFTGNTQKSTMMYKYKFIFIVFIFLNSCSSNLQREKSNSPVILFKQSTIDNDGDLNFDKTFFWKDNMENHTFITQNFDPFQFKEIISRIKKLKRIDNSNPRYSPFIHYAFVVHKVNKRDNDTIYYDGYDNWWVLSKGIYSKYKDESNSLSDNLKMFYPIFRNCVYQPTQ